MAFELGRREWAERWDLHSCAPRVLDAARDEREPGAGAPELVGHIGVIDDDQGITGLREGHLGLGLTGDPQDVLPREIGVLALEPNTLFHDDPWAKAASHGIDLDISPTGLLGASLPNASDDVIVS